MARKWHRLKDNKQTQLPRHFVFFDVETRLKTISDTRIEQVWRLAVAYHVRYGTKGQGPTYMMERFKDPDELWNWIDGLVNAGQRLYVVAHNAEFDFRVSAGYRHLRRLGWERVKSLYNNAMFTLFYRKERATIVVVNSYQWLPLTAEALGDIMDVPKKEMPAFDRPDGEWFDYCERDVLIIAKGVDAYRSMIEENDLGSFALTLAAQAFNAFRHKGSDSDIYIHNNERVLDLERDGYFGGRVECYRIGRFKDGPYYKLDVNSMYPFVMRDNVYPVKLLEVKDSLTPEALWTLALGYYVVARCKVNTTFPFYPKRHKHRLAFPVGSYWTVLHSPELVTALSHGHIEEVTDVATYARGDIFSRYVSSLYALRQQYANEGNKAFAYIVKLLLNSLYGKFGQKGRVSKKVGEDEPDACWVREVIDAETGKPMIYRCVYGVIEREEVYGEAYHSFPTIAGAVTAYARHALLTYILKAGWDNVFYVDTDSLIVNTTGLNNLSTQISPSELGQLKVEGEASSMTILGLKRYTFGGEVKNKGIKRGAIEVAPNLFQVEKWRRIRSALMEGDLDHYYVDKVMVQLQGIYDKGTVMSDGTVRPLVLKE